MEGSTEISAVLVKDHSIFSLREYVLSGNMLTCIDVFMLGIATCKSSGMMEIFAGLRPVLEAKLYSRVKLNSNVSCQKSSNSLSQYRLSSRIFSVAVRRLNQSRY